MASHLGWRRVATWLLTLGLVAFAFVDLGGGSTTPTHPTGDEHRDDAERLWIRDISAAEVSPGEAIVVDVNGVDGDAPLEAVVSRRPAEVLSRRGSRIVVRVPQDTPAGKAALRVEQGGRRSKARDLLVRPPDTGHLIRNLVGGLALLLLGVRQLSAGLRTLAGRRLRHMLAGWTRGRPRAIGAGVVLGGLTQMTTSAATIVVGLVVSRLVGLATAVALLAGAQLGAALAGALLPFALTREALVVVAIGMVWVLFAADRRQGGIGHAVLGAGLVLFGMHLLQTGFAPFASSPQLLGYVGVFERHDTIGWVACAAIGALLAAVLQGPGPVFWLVVGLVETTGALSPGSAMIVLGGTGLGAAIGGLPITLSAGSRGRRLALAHLGVGAISTLVLLATAALWLRITDLALPGPADTLAYGEDVLLPHARVHLGIAYAAAQLGATILATLLLPSLVRRLEPRRALTPLPQTTDDERTWLNGIFERQARALDATFDLCSGGERVVAATAERTLREARRMLEDQPPPVQNEALIDAGSPWQAALATLQLQRALENLLHVAEVAIERDVALGPDELARLRAMHGLCAEGLTALIAAVHRRESPDRDDVRAREIRLNAFEIEARRRIEAPRIGDSMALRLGAIEIFDALEGVGNHIFRVSETLDRNADLD